MKNIRFKSITLFLALFLCQSLAVCVLANEPLIKVTLDGAPIAYEVAPENINGYVLVPIGQTIELLSGEAPYWDATTKTITFTSNGSTIVHKTGTKAITVDGILKEYPQQSVIINSRTLVPIRMFADATDCITDWEPTTKTVVITKPSQPAAIVNGTSQLPSSSSVSFTKPEIVSVAVSSEKIIVGETVTVTVVTSPQVSKTKLQYSALNEDIVSSEPLILDDGNKEFKLNWKITTTGTCTAKIYAGTDSGFTDDFKNVTVATAMAGGAEILDVKIPPLTVDEPVKIIVRTNAKTSTMWVGPEPPLPIDGILIPGGGLATFPNHNPYNCRNSSPTFISSSVSEFSLDYLPTKPGKQTISLTATPRETVSTHKTTIEYEVEVAAIPNAKIDSIVYDKALIPISSVDITATVYTNNYTSSVWYDFEKAEQTDEYKVTDYEIDSQGRRFFVVRIDLYSGRDNSSIQGSTDTFTIFANNSNDVVDKKSETIVFPW